MDIFYIEKTTGKKTYLSGCGEVRTRFDLVQTLGYSFVGTDKETYDLNDLHANNIIQKIITIACLILWAISCYYFPVNGFFVGGFACYGMAHLLGQEKVKANIFNNSGLQKPDTKNP